MTKRFLLGIFMLLLLVMGSIGYTFFFKQLSDKDIQAYGWKGGGCSLPDVLDFRTGTLRLHEGVLYFEDKAIGRMTQRTYRFYADSYMDVQNVQSEETCTYWAKWRN